MRLLALPLAGLSVLALPLAAQTPAPAAPAPVVYTYVEQMPVPPGGIQITLQHIQNHLHYPAQALEKRVEGRVFVGFVVDATGQVQQARVLKGLGFGCDEEALRIIQQMPAWTPGKQNGRAVSVAYTLPVIFRLPELAPEPAAESAYLGAAYPGGPTALRAYLNSAPWPADYPAAAQPVRVFVHFVVDETGQVKDVQPIGPLPAAEAKRLHQRPTLPALPAALVQAAVARVAAMPAWAPARKQGAALASEYTVPVVFGGAPDAGPYVYAEQMPVLTEPNGELYVLGRHVRYPAEALRNQTQGAALLYYEVSEQGRVEQVAVIRSVSKEIDAEAKRVLETAFPAYQPARQQGQPVRTFYVLPVTFTIR
jgi:TonB family protein